MVFLETSIDLTQAGGGSSQTVFIPCYFALIAATMSAFPGFMLLTSGQPQTFTVTLSTTPTATVNLTASTSSGAFDVFLNSTQLNSSNWQSGVTGEIVGFLEGSSGTITITATSSDTRFDGATAVIEASVSGGGGKDDPIEP